MNTIYVIRTLEMQSAVKGKFKTMLIWYVGIPIFGLMGFLPFFIADELFYKAIGLAIAILCLGLGGYQILEKEREYVPGKTFPFLRKSKEKIKSYTLYISVAVIIFFCLCLLFDPELKLTRAGYVISGIVGMIALIYYTNKSFKVHEDVDYVSSAEMEQIIGVEIDEKIQATYQNFDSSEEDCLNDDCNIMMVTDKKIYFAYYDSNHWHFVNKKLDEISRLGYTGEGQEEYCLRLEFVDSTTIMLHMDTMGKMTSNSTLFLKKFLEVLDAVVLGTVDEKISSRRRVSVNSATPDAQHSEQKTEERKLDLGNSIIEGLRNATPVESGRVIEL